MKLVNIHATARTALMLFGLFAVLVLFMVISPIKRDEDMTPFSQGEWRITSDGTEITTSPRGVLEDSKRVCRFENVLKPKEEVVANGKVIAAAPRMLKVLEALGASWEAIDKRADGAEHKEAMMAEVGAILDSLRES
jgi:hypothetical protein